MGRRHLAELLLLAAIWGASFLFMRVAAPAFGPLPAAALRIGLGALLLLPVVLLRGGFGALRGKGRHVLVAGLLNSALPACLFSFAALSVSAGLSAILNATTPLWGGLVAHLWLKDRLTGSRALGLLVGFGGVTFLFWGRASFRPGGAGLAVVAALLATLMYGVAASYAKRHLAGVNPLAAAGGSLLAGGAVLAPAGLWAWPAAPIPPTAWAAVLGLAALCTSFAYVIYYRLIAGVGPARAVAVTFLIPPFAMLWGGLVLGERIDERMLSGACVVLVGTALATGVARLPVGRHP